MGNDLTVADLEKLLRSSAPPPVVVIAGEEALLRSRAAAILRAPFEEAGEAGSFERLDGADKQLSLDEVLDAARSLPLFAMMASGPSRLVHVARFELMKVDDLDPLAAYLDEPVGETVLVLEFEKIDKRKALYKLLVRKKVPVIACDPVKSEADVARWITRTAAARGHEIERAAVVYLTEMAGASLAQLEQELEKVMLFVGEGEPVRSADLEGLLGRSREHSVFDLTDSLVAGRADEAVRLMNRLVDDGEDPLRLLPMIAWITRQLVIAHELTGHGLPRKAVMERLAGRWASRGAVLDRARRADGSILVDSLAACVDADLFVKRLRDGRSGADRLRPARGRLEALCRQICAA